MTGGELELQAATPADAALLAEMNFRLIRDEKHRNSMGLPELEQRMRRWLETGEYSAILLKVERAVVGYALYRSTEDGVYVRQLYIKESYRRNGYGRKAVQKLRNEVWPANARVTLEVLAGNAQAHSFWKSVGFMDYAMTMEMKNIDS